MFENLAFDVFVKWLFFGNYNHFFLLILAGVCCRPLMFLLYVISKGFSSLFFGCFSFFGEFSPVLWKSRGFASVICELLGLWKTKKTPYFLGVFSNLMSKSSASSGRLSCFLMLLFNCSIASSAFL